MATLEVSLWLTALSFFLLGIWWQRKSWFFIWQVNGVRGLLHQPLLWLLLVLFMDPNSILNVVCSVRRYFLFKSPLAIYLGRRILLYVDDPTTTEQILNSSDCLDKTFMQDGFFARKGLLHAKGQQWKIRRKQLNPAFNTNILLSFFPIFNEVSNSLQYKFNNFLGDEIKYAALEDIISRAVLDVACRTTMSTEANFLEKDSETIAASYKFLMHISAVKNVKPWLQNDFLFRLLSRRLYDCERKCNSLVDDFVNKIVTRKYCEWKRKQNREYATKTEIWKDVEDSDEGVTSEASVELRKKSVDNDSRKRVFIEQVFHLADSGELTLQDIIDESHSMVMVASETVTNNLLIALLLLAMHTDCQRKLRHEINDAFPLQLTTQPQSDAPNVISNEHLKQMPYLDMVVNESLRLLTTVPMNSRNVNRDFPLKLKEFKQADVVIPAGIIVVFDVFNMQRDPLYWGSRSLQFYPEHFAEPTSEQNPFKRRHPYAFIPFSKGLRWCIGGRYSIWLTKILLIRLIQNYEFETRTKLEDLHFVEGVTLKFSNCDRIKFSIKKLSK